MKGLKPPPKKNTANLFFRKPKGNNPLWKPWGIWEDKVKLDLKDMKCDYVG